jgi:hypothetical protein
MERFADAARDWDRVVELDQSPDPWLNRVLRAMTLARAGEHTRATEEAKALEAKESVIPDGRYALACAYALSVGPAKADPRLPSDERARLAEQYAASGVAALEKLHGQGYFKDPKHAKTLKEDPDLQPLRNRKDFHRLLD